MNKHTYVTIALAFLLITSSACSAGGTALPSELENGLTAESQQEQTTGSEPSNPIATTAPSQDAGNADSAAGPETIDLTNAALYIIPDSPAFRFESTIKYAGVDMTGAAKEVSEIGSTEVQNLPQVTQRFVWALEGYVDPPGSSGNVNILTSDTVIIGDQMTSAQMVSVNGAAPKLFCNSGLASEVQGPSLFDNIPRIQEWLTGQ
ncbi:MAG: hypothetical protein E4G90_01010, partial [Gemmatimonadales bacterium]